MEEEYTSLVPLKSTKDFEGLFLPLSRTDNLMYTFTVLMST